MGHDAFLFFKILPIAGLATLLPGCASTARYSAMPPLRPLGAEYSAVEATAEVETMTPVSSALKLSDALALALRNNPELAAFSYEVRAAEARMLQAGTLPNPELELEVDAYNRDGAGFDSAETSVVLGQVFELGGKRYWRKRVAQAEGELAGWDYESQRLAVFAETAQRFAEALAAQERLALTRSSVELAERTNRAVRERVAAGKEPPLQTAKSEAELELARLDALEAEQALAVARQRLAALWGAQQAGFESVEGDLSPSLTALPPLEVLRPYLAQNPALARWETELRFRQATLASEKAACIPDLRGSVGYARYEEDGTDAIRVSVALPLPIFDRNHGNIAAATHGLAKAEAERTAMEIALLAELAGAHAALRISHERALALHNKVLPAMEQAFQAAHEGYQQGKFGLLDVLDAQRSLNDAKVSHLEALAAYHKAAVDMERLTGTPLNTIQ